MNKFIHVMSISLLMHTVFVSAEAPTPPEPAPPTKDAVDRERDDRRDERIAGILAGVTDVVGSLIKIIQNPHQKQDVIQNVGHMISGITHIASHAARSGDIRCPEDIKALHEALLEEMSRHIDPALRVYVARHAAELHNYLRTAPIEEIENLVRVDDDAAIEGQADQSNPSEEVAFLQSALEAQQAEDSA